MRMAVLDSKSRRRRRRRKKGGKEEERMKEKEEERKPTTSSRGCGKTQKNENQEEGNTEGKNHGQIWSGKVATLKFFENIDR